MSGDTLPADAPAALAPAWRRRAAILGLAAAAVVGLLAWGMTRGGAPAGPAGRTPPPVSVVAEPARVGPMRRVLDGIGTVTPLASVTVRSRVDGQLMAVHFAEGDVVEEGALLAEIDPRPFAVALAQAEAQMARDRALLANARVDLERYRRLVAQDSLPQQQLDTQQALVRQYEAALQADEAQIDQARLQLTYARITAPIGGRLGLRLVDPGNIVHAGDAGGLVTIAQTAPIAVLFTIPEDSVPAVLERLRGAAPLPVEIHDRAHERLLAVGRLLTVDNAIDVSTGTLRLKAEVPNDDGALFPNQFVNARLLLERRDDATLIPLAAVQRGPDGPYAYVVQDDQTAARRALRLGLADAGLVAIEDGIAPGEMVVLDGADAIRDDRPVALRTPLAVPPP